MIRIHWSHKLDSNYANQLFDSLSADGLEFHNQQIPIKYNQPYASAELLKPLIYVIGLYSAGFLTEAGKQSFKALAPSIKSLFTSLLKAIDTKKVLLNPGKRKFVMLNIIVEDLGGPRITFMFTDEDEEKFIEVMVTKATEFILSAPFQKYIKNFDQYSFKDQAYLKTLELQFDKENLVWKAFNLSQYVVNGKLTIKQ